MGRRLTYFYVKAEFEQIGYELLSKLYEGSSGKLEYKCSNGHIHSISWDNFKAGKRCPHCAGNVCLSIEFIKKKFIARGYILLTKKYKNNYQKLKYICPNGHKHSIRWNHFKRGHGCRYCAGKIFLSIDYIKPYFEKENCVLLSSVCESSKQKLEYLCPVGHRNSTHWNSWQSGKRCAICAHIKQGISISGSNHPGWKGGISCEPYCQDWTKEYKNYIKERDGNKCLNPDCRGISKRLAVHHIDYDKKHCSRQNLITLCTSCNSRANKNRTWHMSWYNAIIEKRYGKNYG